MENSPEFISIIAGINKIQGIGSLINVNQRKKALIHSFEISDPLWIIVDGESLNAFNEVFLDLNFDENKVFVINNPEKHDHDFMDFHKELDIISVENPATTFRSYLTDMSVYIFTSGTTGLPKAALQDNRRILNPFGWLAFELTPRDVVYSPLPLYHSLALVVGWAGAIQAGAAFAFRKRFSASEFWDCVEKYKVNGFYIVPTMWNILLRVPEADTKDTSSLRLGLSGAAPIPPEQLDECERRFHIPILEAYGATENSGGITANMEGKRKYGSIGTAFFGFALGFRSHGTLLFLILANLFQVSCRRSLAWRPSGALFSVPRVVQFPFATDS